MKKERMAMVIVALIVITFWTIVILAINYL